MLVHLTLPLDDFALLISNQATLCSIGMCQGWGSRSEKTTWLGFLRIVYLGVDASSTKLAAGR